MRNFDVAIILFHILESLQMQRQYHWQLFDAHPLLRLLVTAAIVALELVVAAQRFGIAEAAQTVRYARILIHIHLQIEKVFIFAANRFAIQTSGFTSQNTLENLVHPGRFLWLAGIVPV